MRPARLASHKGQVSMEFILLFGFSMLVVIMLMGVTSSLIQDTITDRQFLALRDLGDRLQGELTLAAGVHEGYTRSITVPDTVEGYDYTINTTTSQFTLLTQQVQLVYRTPPLNGSLHKGTTIITLHGGLLSLS